MLRIQLFGHLVCTWEGRPVKIGGLPRTVPLLAYLLLNRQTPLPRNRLAYTLWPDYGEADARANLRRHLHDLRRQLPAAPADCPWVLADTTTIQWNPAAAVWVDVAEFLAHTDLNQTPAPAVAAAVDLYTGDLLADLYDDWIFFEREQLRERCLAALAWLVQVHRRDQDFARALHWAQKIVHLDPMREDVVRTIMELRFAAGDRAGALQEYRRFEQRLRAEMDVPPMPETQALYDTMARQRVLAAGTPSAPPELAEAVPAAQPIPTIPPTFTPPATLTNIPAAVTAFIGRDLELHELRHLLVNTPHPVRLLTLTGPAGCGKTRLALEFAHRFLAASSPFEDGIHVVWLSTLTGHDQVLRAIAESFGIVEQFGQSLIQNLKQFFAPKRLLLILDNFEHLLPAGRQLVELLSAAPNLAILLTSRALLRVYGEHEYYVRPMRVPLSADTEDADTIARTDAVALFLARSRAVNPAFVLTHDNARDIATICIRLDGLPLAIELAAARTKLLPPAAILARLDNRLEFLTDRQQSHTGRHRTLRATLDWSYQLLAPEEQQLFVLLAVFPDSFTVEAAEAVGESCLGGGIFERLETLVDNSLLVSLEPEPGGAPRLRMLSTLHEYARDRLLHDPHAEHAGRAHAEYYAGWVAAEAAGLRGPHQVAGQQRIHAEQANLRTALAWIAAHGEPDNGIQMVADLERYWSRSGSILEGSEWLARLLELATPVTSTRYAWGLLVAAQLYFWISDANYPRVRALCDEALVLCRAAGDALGTARGEQLYAETLVMHGPRGEAIPRLRAALAGFTAAGDPLRRADVLQSLGFAMLLEGDAAGAAQMHAECAQIYRSHGDLWSVGFLLLLQSNTLHYILHQSDAARTVAHQAWELARHSSDPLIYALALVNLADIALTQEDYAAVAPLATEALALFRSSGELWQPPRLVRMLGHVDAHYGRVDAAAAAFRESLHLNRALDDRRGMSAALLALAKLAVTHDHPEVGAKLIAGVQMELARAGLTLLPADEATLTTVNRLAAAALPPAALAAARAAGEACDLDGLVALAATLSLN